MSFIDTLTRLAVGWGTGTTLSALAYKDMVASTHDNHDLVMSILQAAKKNNANFDPYCASGHAFRYRWLI